MTMRLPFIFIFSFVTTFCCAQNSARLLSADGTPFKVLQNGIVLNKNAEASLLIENVLNDTLNLMIEFENKHSLPITIYLLDKGKKTNNKEYNYQIVNGQQVKAIFTGMYDPVSLPDPIVPQKPIVDTSHQRNNNLLEHFCELKNGKPVYFNNMPLDEKCKTPMPGGYLGFTDQLIKRAQSDEAKFRIVEGVCRNNCIFVSQLVTLLNYIEYELEKLKLAKLAVQSLTDPDHLNMLEKSFRYESTFVELKKFAGR
ncbi:MAG TPA: DUF4476 domain-containing protein [Bacteroidia bacterium]|nr:DUF4476 domain-containing protein [Bacteroidia bacterium]